MTTHALGAALEPNVHAPSAPRRSSVLEFLVTGGGTLALFPVAWACRAGLGLDAAEFWVGLLAFHAASLINDPHFAVTYLLFYRDFKGKALGQTFAPGQRFRYGVVGVGVPLLLAVGVGTALATRSAHALGLMIQLMFLLVGWHYVKQGFGVLVVLSARRGVRYGAFERNVLLGHCYAGWAYAWASPSDAGTKSVVQGVFYTSLAHPPGLELVAGIAFAASSLALLWVLLQKWRREARLPPLAALAGFLVSIWIWTVYTRLDPLLAYVIPALHSLQYLYFVGLLTRNQAREAAGPPSFKGNPRLRLALLGASAVGLGWLSLRGAPAFLDGALVLGEQAGRALPALGPTPYLAAFVVFVNIHHYFMDYVIWRRDHPDMRYLFQDKAA